MLIEASALVNFPILSLHVGGAISRVSELVISPEKLQIVAFNLNNYPGIRSPETGTILETRDVREFSRLGMIVDSEEVFANPGEVEALDKVLSYQFSPINLKVVTKKGTKLGKVVNFTIDSDNFKIMQLIVKRPWFKSSTDPELIVPRSQVIEVSDYEIIVKNEEDEIRKVAVRENFQMNFVNPFREPDFSQDKISPKQESE